MVSDSGAISVAATLRDERLPVPSPAQATCCQPGDRRDMQLACGSRVRFSCPLSAVARLPLIRAAHCRVADELSMLNRRL